MSELIACHHKVTLDIAKRDVCTIEVVNRDTANILEVNVCENGKEVSLENATLVTITYSNDTVDEMQISEDFKTASVRINANCLKRGINFAKVCIYSGDNGLITAEMLTINCKQTVGSDNPSVPDPDMPKLKEMIEELVKQSASSEQIAAAVSQYLKDNPITETDPTVPAWAKETNKPTYTAAEVGALSEGTLDTAINEALAQAKASGEFDGADGITPTIGDNGNWYLGSTDTGKPSRGEKGPKGDTGETGPAGIGVPDGGTEGQLLGKTSDGPAWVDMPESGLPTGGAPYQQLVTDGTGKATWEDRTHWVEQSVAELIPEQTLSGGMSMEPPYMFNVSYFTIIPNLEYTVVFDGVEYKCISAELNGATYIGNATLLGAPVEDTGEPFFIAPISGMSVITATDGPHTIALSGWSIVYHQLPLDYIPNGKFLNGFIEHSSLTMTRDEVSRYREILSKSLFPMLVWQDFRIKSISTGTSHGVNVIRIADYDGALYTITENSDGLYSVDDANNGYNYLYIKKGNSSKSRLLLEGGKPVSIEGVQESTGNALDYTTFCVKKTGRRNGQDFEVLGNGAVKAYSVILPSSTAGSTKKFKITVDDSGTISATEVV